jgi:hypothetical protein
MQFDEHVFRAAPSGFRDFILEAVLHASIHQRGSSFRFKINPLASPSHLPAVSPMGDSNSRHGIPRRRAPRRGGMGLVRSNGRGQ